MSSRARLFPLPLPPTPFAHASSDDRRSSRIARVFAQEGRRTRHGAVEETLALTLALASGVTGTLLCSDAAQGPYFWEAATGENPLLPRAGENVLTILGTAGSVAVPELRRWHAAPIADGGDGDWTHVLQADDALAQRDNTVGELFDVQLRHFARVIEGAEAPRCSGADGLAALLVVQAVAESMRTGLPVDVREV